MDKLQRDKLVDRITTVFLKSVDNQQKKDAKQLLVDSQVLTGTQLLELLAQPSIIMSYDDLLLFHVATVLHNVYKSRIDVQQYFSEYETKKYSTAEIRKDTFNEEFLILKNVFQIAENQWSCVATVEQLATLKNQSILRVDSNFQRQSVNKRVSSDEIMQAIYVNWNRTAQIQELLASDQYYYNTVRINQLNLGDGNPPEISTDANGDRIIVLNPDEDLIVPDGNHRLWAATRAYYSNPDLAESGFFSQRYFSVIFTHLTPAQTRKCIYQEWQVENVSQAHKKSMSDANANKIIQIIKNSPDAESLYAQKISTTLVGCMHGNALMFTGWLAPVLEVAYDVNEMRLDKQLKDVANWIIEVLNYIAELTVDDLFNLNASYQKRRPLISPSVWESFVYLSACVREKDDWKKIVQQIISEEWTWKPFVDSRNQINIAKIRKYYNNRILG